MESLRQDLRHAARRLAASPGFAAVAVLTLALGVGANTAIFTVVDSVLLAPLPYGAPERLVLVWNRMVETDNPKAPVSAPDLVDYREQARLFSGLAATNNVNEMTITGDGPPEQLRVGGVTPDFFAVLDASPRLGRTFEPADAVPFPADTLDDSQAEIPPTAIVLSHGLWQRRFAGDPEILGRALTVNGLPMTVVGVMGPEFRVLMPPDAGMPTDIDAWTPLRFNLAAGARDQQFLRVVGRLAPGATLEAAQAEMDAIARRHRAEHAFHRNMGIEIDVVPMHGDVVGAVRPVLLALAGAVGFVLLIACANVANLLLARAAARGREVAVRTALGAGRWRIVRAVLAEGLLLAVAGGLAGLGLAWVGVQALLALRPPELPRVETVNLDGRVLAFAAGAALVAALLASLAPAAALLRVPAWRALQERGSGAGARLRLRGALVVAEVALSLVLLVGAGLMLRSFLLLQQVRPGFEPQGALTLKLSPSFQRYPAPADRTGFFARYEERLEALPGVAAVGAVFPLPLSGRLWTGPYGLPGESVEDWSKREGNFRVVTPGYFEALGARLVSGRGFETADLEEARPVAVVDAALAAKLFGAEPAVGRRLGLDLFGNPQELEVVGVLEPVRHADLTGEERETVYFPQHLFPFVPMTVVVRAGGDPAALADPARRELAILDPDMPAYDVRPLADYVSQALAASRFASVLIGLLAALAVVLAAIGLAGLVAYAVRQRTREIGVRMALGATRASILRLVLLRGSLLVGVGLACGLAAALVLTRLMANLLYGVTPTDPLTFAAIPALLAAVALVAGWLPARRAAEVQPMESLRLE